MQIENFTTEELFNNIIEGILKKKGKEIVVLNFEKIENAVCQQFIICHADSNTQAKAISDSVEETVKENLKAKVWHREGVENAQWILLDYGQVLIHIFQKEFRDYYKLESLWADATMTTIGDNV
jgi:ribosome-associated protein